jgi:hypothetical protein
MEAETDAAYAAFNEWLHASDSDGGRPDVYTWAQQKDDPQVRSWVLQWAEYARWEDRAADYDDALKLQVVAKVYPLMSPIFMKFYRILRLELDRWENTVEKAGPAPGTLDFRTLTTLFTQLHKMEGSCRDFALREKEQASAMGPDTEVVDFMRLTADELRLHESLMSKARVN